MELKKVGFVLSYEGGNARHTGLYVIQNMCVGMTAIDREEFFCPLCEN
jgi:hypothetical protein